ncbi:unnamed protein product [Leptosia nina]|uniref:trypsin n=1 Tax=Leptosia nina TaxID=320188 RepID=A0AAV1JGV3_9NEOP
MLRYLLTLILVSAVQCDDTDADTRIVGGSDAADGEFPYQVSLRLYNYRNVLQHFCGGSIIAPLWVLSAAHCTIEFQKENIVVVVGTNSLSNGGAKYEVDKIILHEDYNRTSYANDVEVIKVKREIQYGEKVKPISLPTADTPGGVELIVSGWGYTNNYRRTPDKLQKLTVKSLSVEDCQNSDLKRFKNTNPITDHQICTYTRENEGICQGDSGGPLARNGEVVGLASWVIPCGRGRPDVFTRVYSYVDWIKEKTGI